MQYRTGIIIGIVASIIIVYYREYVKTTLPIDVYLIEVSYWFILGMCLFIGIGGAFMMNSTIDKNRLSGNTVLTQKQRGVNDEKML